MQDTQLPRLPAELWAYIFQRTDKYYLKWERNNRAKAATCRRRKEPEPPYPDIYLFFGSQWRRLASFMLVCKEWYEIVWRSINSLSCGIGRRVPLGKAVNNILRKVGPQLARLEVVTNFRVKMEERNEELRLALSEVAKHCPNLGELFLPRCKNHVDLSELFSEEEGKMPSDWSESLLVLYAHSLTDEQLRFICAGQTPLKALKKLTISSEANRLTGEAIAKYLPCLPMLTELDISKLLLDDKSYANLFQELPNLLVLHAANTNLLQSREGVAALACCQGLKVDRFF